MVVRRELERFQGPRKGWLPSATFSFHKTLNFTMIIASFSDLFGHFNPANDAKFNLRGTVGLVLGYGKLGFTIRNETRSEKGTCLRIYASTSGSFCCCRQLDYGKIRDGRRTASLFALSISQDIVGKSNSFKG